MVSHRSLPWNPQGAALEDFNQREPIDGAKAQSEKLSKHFRELVALCKTRPVTFEDLFRGHAEEANALFVLFLSVPFLFPMPLPGLSIPFGVCIAAAGLRLFLGKGPWVPERWRSRKLPQDLLLRMFTVGERAAIRLEKVVRPRAFVFHRSTWVRSVNGTLIILAGLLLAAPLPPGTNFPPALVIVLLAIGTLEEDGLFIAFGYLAFVFTVVVFSLMFVLGYHGVRTLIGI